ncbi:MAG: c-type cytochrome [Burkholderiales bacterium]
MLPTGEPQANPTTQILNRGEYLARAGDCVACHTAPGGKEFAGGRAMPTPFGNLYVPNITPDDETGIGRWTADEFYRMMHTGISRDGTLLYPAMPFASYTKVTREDCDAIFAYLMSVPPVRQENRKHELRFPYNNRQLLVGWRALYFREGEYVPEPNQSAQWNRGAYLVEGLGHCSMCHTAINILGGSSESKAFEGGMIPNQNWYAPSLTSNREAGLGDWSIKDISDLLQIGISHRGTVYGPMAEVVYNSLQYISDEDIAAMAVYLKSLPPRESGPPVPSSARLVQPAGMELGRKVYEKQCAMCHGEEGKGKPPLYPPLADNQSITMAIPVNPIRMVLNGGYPPGTKKNPRPHGMPPFSHILSDDEAAAVVTYIRVAWGNTGTPVTPAQVNELRKLLPE